MQFSVSHQLNGRFKEYMRAKSPLDPQFFNIFDFEENQSRSPDLLWNFSPSTDPYYSPLNPIFLHALDSIDDLTNAPEVLSRDGLLPLLWFFERMPLPSSPCKILVHDDFEKFIPEDWRPFFGTYRVFEKRKRITVARTSKILLHALAVKNFLSISFLRSQLELMLREIDRQDLQINEFIVFLSFRDDPFYRQESDKYNCLFMSEINQALGSKITFVSQKEFYSRVPFSECKMFEINRNYFVADNFISFYAQSCGAELLLEKDPPPPLADSFQIDLSPHHGMTLRKSLPECTLGPGLRERLSRYREIALAEDEPRPERPHIWTKSFIQYVKKSVAQI